MPVVDCATYLGFKVHSNLGWDCQITHVAKKASRRLHFLRLLAKGGMPPEDLVTVYTTLVRPVLEYANVVYVGCTESQRKTLEAVQKRAMKIVNRNNNSPTSVPLVLPTLQSRREDAARTLLTRMRATDHPLHYMVTSERKEETEGEVKKGKGRGEVRWKVRE